MSYSAFNQVRDAEGEAESRLGNWSLRSWCSRQRGKAYTHVRIIAMYDWIDRASRKHPNKQWHTINWMYVECVQL